MKSFIAKSRGVERFIAKNQILEARTDMCAFGLVVRDRDGKEGPALKPTRFITNSVAVHRELQRRCRGCKEHVPLEGKSRTTAAARYPKELCRAVCRGVRDQMRMDPAGIMSMLSLADSSDDGDDDHLDSIEHEEHDWGQYYDDMSGSVLRADLVQAARREEIAEVRRMGVWTKVPREQCVRETGKPPIGTRWVDVDKGTPDAPNVRSRVVAQEINRGRRPDLFSATPPLEYMRFLVSCCASSQWGKRPTRLLVVDVKNAYFYAPSRRRVFVELPEEDRVEGEDMVGLLQRSLYGTRDAASNWAEEYTRVLEKLMFTKGASSPCSLYSAERDIKIVVHGDDFLCEGALDDLRWLRGKLAEAFSIKASFLGPEDGCERELKLQNRTISWEDGGISWEADPRHVDLLLEQLNLDPKTLSSVGTPIVKEAKTIDPSLVGVGVDMIDVFGEESLEDASAPRKHGDDLHVTQDGTRWVSPAGACPQGKNMFLSLSDCFSSCCSDKGCSKHSTTSGLDKVERSEMVTCVECSSLQDVSSKVCGVCESALGGSEPVLNLQSDSRLELIMKEHGWSKCASSSSTTTSRWRKAFEGARNMVVNPAGVLKRRTTRDVAGGHVIEDLIVNEYTPGRRLSQSLRRPRDIEVEVEISAVDDQDEASDVPWSELPMEAAEATRYRAIAARLNYLAMDRPDLLYTAKECARSMAAPRNGDLDRLKRVARYLVGVRRLVFFYEWQDPAAYIGVYSDSDWAGCARTRKSTSGAGFFFGNHLVRAYSKTQANIALSSGEAELYSLVTAASEGLGLRAMAVDFGLQLHPPRPRGRQRRGGHRAAQGVGEGAAPRHPSAVGARRPEAKAFEPH